MEGFVIFGGQGKPPGDLVRLVAEAREKFFELQRQHTSFTLHGKACTEEELRRHIDKRCLRVRLARLLRRREVKCPHGHVQFNPIPVEVLERHANKIREGWEMRAAAAAAAKELDDAARKRAKE